MFWRLVKNENHVSGGSRIFQVVSTNPEGEVWRGCVNLLLPPANEVCEGYVFTGVCLSTGGGDSTCAGTPPRSAPGRYTPTPQQVHPQTSTPLLAGTPPGRYPPPRQVPPGRYTPQQVHPPGQFPPQGRYTPRSQCMLGYGQQAGGTHPTGMHS